MGDFRLPLRSNYGRDDGLKWAECTLCGKLRKSALLHFKQGAVTPTLTETITGASSGDTGILAKYVKVSGTFAGGDATGIFIMTSPTGYDDANLEVFTKGENLTGSTSGAAFAVATNKGAVQVAGRLVPDTELITYQGKDYCRAHFQFKFEREWLDEAKVDSDESDRGK